MKRCTKCVLPENYPGIVFNQEGICNYCTAHQERKYLGKEVLSERIKQFLQTKNDRDRDYDCVLALSGGRDSSYLLYYLVKELELQILTYSVDNGFIPKQTQLNMQNMARTMNVELVIEKDECLERCIRHHILSFIHRPSAAMIGLLCTGCRLARATKIPNFARNNRIPVIISGSNPLDVKSYKQKIMLLDPNSKSKFSFVGGYLFRVIQNPMWILNFNCLVTQIEEYYHHFYRKGRSSDLFTIAPFSYYIKWEEQEVISRIETEFNWKKHPGVESTWRGDCDIALLKLYLYKKMLGFNDKDEGLSYLVRDGQISREQALERLKEESEIPEEVVKGILDKLKINFSDLKAALEH